MDEKIDYYKIKNEMEEELNKECQKCGYNIICNSGCMAIKMKKYGNDFIAYKDPRCEIVHNEELK